MRYYEPKLLLYLIIHKMPELKKQQLKRTMTIILREQRQYLQLQTCTLIKVIPQHCATLIWAWPPAKDQLWNRLWKKVVKEVIRLLFKGVIGNQPEWNYFYGWIPATLPSKHLTFMCVSAASWGASTRSRSDAPPAVTASSLVTLVSHLFPSNPLFVPL